MLSKDYPIHQICHALNVNRSSYLYWVKYGLIHQENQAFFYCQIIQAYADSKGIYGAPKITYVLRSQGISCSISRVSKAMALLGIRSIVNKRFPKKVFRMTEKEKALIVNLIKDLEITHLNQVWTTDITYIPTINEGTFYLISYIDYFSKKVVAWGLFEDQKADKLVLVLKKAIKERNPSPGLISHSDKGTQMRSKLYRDFLRKHNIVPSYTSLNQSCDENAAQESFHASLKKECLYQHKIYSFEDAYKYIYDYIEGFYNPIRLHSSIGYLSPNQLESRL